MYDSAEYARDRLQQTIISFNGKPFRVRTCAPGNNGSIIVNGNYIDTNLPANVFLQDMDLTPVKLGFANTPYGVAYLARIPLRRDWKQGLRDNTLRSCWGVEARWVDDKSLSNCIMGIYPSFMDAIEEVVNTSHPIAFSRHFALINIEGKINLVYKFHGKVGDVISNKPLLSPKWNFLIELLYEELK